MGEAAVWERWRQWSAEREAVFRCWQDAGARLDAAAAAAERHAGVRERELAAASGGLTARQRTAARQHAATGARPVSREARVRLASWIYHADAVDEAQTRWAPVGRADAAAVRAARADLGVATGELLVRFGDQAVAITGHPLRDLAALATADRGD